MRRSWSVPAAGALLAAAAACHAPPIRSAHVIRTTVNSSCFTPDPTSDFSVTVVTDTAFRDSAYMRHLLGDVVDRWDVPVPLVQRRTDVGFRVLRGGKIVGVQVTKRSFFRDYDERAKRALDRLAADTVVDSVPVAWSRDTLPVEVHFGDQTAERALAQFFMSVPKPPVPDEKNQMPEYPASLIAQGVKGRVVVTFIVDTAGTVDMSSVQVVTSPHPEMTRAVLGVLSSWKFRPARIRGCALAREVSYPFYFGVEPPRGASNGLPDDPDDPRPFIATKR